MPIPSLEQLFAAFRTTRDGAALAAVFDATAAELLLVAVHLVGDRALAEDVVQTTFVEVIERADAWDASRPLKPWLVGVLANRARMALRSKRRRTMANELGEPEAPAATADPAAAAEANERAQHVASALAGLPSHYRQVLVLHLVHGLNGVQIAQALERPPATVRTQIKRGLELLRGALPAALALPAAMLAVEGRGLAAVRAAVLEHVRAPVAGSVATTAITAAGGMMVAKKALLGVVAAAIAVAVWLAVDRTPLAHEPFSRDANPQPAPLAAASRPATAQADAPGGGAPREAAPATAPEASAAVTVRGRVVAARDGSPQVAETIRIRAYALDHLDEASRSPRMLGDGPSRADGTFEFSFPFVAGMRHSIEIEGSEFVHARGGFDVRGPGAVDLGDVRVHRGARLRARVVDEQERAVPNVWFVVHFETPAFDGTTASSMTGARTDAYGVLTMRDDARLFPGELALEPPDGYEILRSARFRVPTGAETAEPVVVVRALPADRSIAGRVVDERGQGIRNVRVLVGSQDRCFTRADGAFRVFRTADDGEQATARLAFLGSTTKLGVADQSVAWGVQDLVILQRDALTVPLLVVADDTGEPITDYKVHFGAAGDPLFHRGDLDRHWRLGTHEAGRSELGGLPPDGTLNLIVWPADDRYELSPQLGFDLPRPHAGEPLVVRLLPRRSVVVHVVDAADAPVAGSLVRLVQLNPGQQLADDTAFGSREDAWMGMHPRSQARWPRPWRIDSGTTDASGRVELRCARPNADVGVLVTGAHRPFRATLQALGDEPFRAVVAPGAALRGRLVPPDFVARCSRSPDQPDAQCLSLVIRRAGTDDVVPPAGGRERGHPIAADGTFAVAGLEPGRYELVLDWWRSTSETSRTQAVLAPPLATVELTSGTVRDLGEVDAARFSPAVVRGRVFAGGVPLRGGRVTLRRTHVDGTGREVVEPNLGPWRIGDEGAFAAGGLLPGRYTLHAELLAADGAAKPLTSEEFVVPAGATLERSFALE